MPFGFNTTSSNSKSSSTSESGPWEAQQPYLQDVFSQAQNLFQPGSQPGYYQGDQIADLNPQQLAALQQIQSAAGNDQYADPTARAYRNMVQGPQIGMGADMAPQQLNPFLNDMYDSGAGRLTQNYNESVQPGINAMFRGAGAGGGSAHALATGAAAEGLGTSLADFGANLYGKAYEGDQNRRLGALGLAPHLQQTQFAPGEAALGAGNVFQQQQQSEIDANIAQHNYESGGGAADWLTQYRNLIYPAINTSSGSSTKPKQQK